MPNQEYLIVLDKVNLLIKAKPNQGQLTQVSNLEGKLYSNYNSKYPIPQLTYTPYFLHEMSSHAFNRTHVACHFMCILYAYIRSCIMQERGKRVCRSRTIRSSTRTSSGRLEDQTWPKTCHSVRITILKTLSKASPGALYSLRFARIN